jgi:regulator of nucleoside diphosphate kinase
VKQAGRSVSSPHRTIKPVAAEQPSSGEVSGIDLDGLAAMAGEATLAATGIGPGDKVVLVFADDHKRISARLTEGDNDLEKGRLSVSSPLGKSILGADEGDEVELPLENGRQRKVLIESVEKSPVVVAVSGGIKNPAEGTATMCRTAGQPSC